MPTTTLVVKTNAYGRKYSDQQDATVHTAVASKNGEEANVQAWIMLAFFASGGLAVMAVASVYRRRSRNTRQVDIVSPEDGPIMNDSDGFVE
jgi:hypothetical protein